MAPAAMVAAYLISILSVCQSAAMFGDYFSIANEQMSGIVLNSFVSASSISCVHTCAITTDCVFAAFNKSNHTCVVCAQSINSSAKVFSFEVSTGWKVFTNNERLNYSSSRMTTEATIYSTTSVTSTPVTPTTSTARHTEETVCKLLL